jgi:hypothetical protein
VRVGAGLGLVVLLAGPATALAQPADLRSFDWSTEATVLGANALLGGGSALVAALVRRDPPLPAFARGVAGGGLIYAGKRIAVDPRPGTGLIGRQVASVGGSVVGNAVGGRQGLDRVALAFGPVRAYLGREVAGVDWRLDVPALAAAVWGVATGGEIDIVETQSSGAVVLRGDRELALPGTVFYSPADRERAAYVLAHERVHVLQYDQSYLMWGGPLEGWLARRYPGLRGVLERLEFNLPVLATAAVLGFVVWPEHDRQPWEQEAIYLGRTGR